MTRPDASKRAGSDLIGLGVIVAGIEIERGRRQVVLEAEHRLGPIIIGRDDVGRACPGSGSTVSDQPLPSGVKTCTAPITLSVMAA